MSKAILVLGATGKQGGAVIKNLLAHRAFSPTSYTIFAVTRNIDSAGAQRLSQSSPAIKLLQGNFQNAPALFQQLPADTQLHGVYTMTNPGKREAEEGIAIADEAAKWASAAHPLRFVFSSVDRGPANDRNSATAVPHFITKHKVEARLRELAGQQAGFSYTILRPPFFLDNLEPGFFGRVFATVWRDNVPQPMAVVATPDIGKYGAAAFLEPDYANAELNIAGDRLTFAELDAKFQARTGQPVPVAYSVLAKLLLWLSYDVRMMARFFADPGFAADPVASRKLQPMTSVDEWLDQSKHTKIAA